MPPGSYPTSNNTRKILSVVGARPNFMKMAPIHRALIPYSEEMTPRMVHTGQHYGPDMSDAFFTDLKMPAPDFFLGVGSGSHAEQTGRIMIAFEEICRQQSPDLVLVAGDVNSTLACALTASKCGIRVAHIEAGLRSYDRSMPEEINRLATDSIADFAFITEASAQENLLREGWKDSRIFFVGNTMIDSLQAALPQARDLRLPRRLGLSSRQYVLVTLHRPTNVDRREELMSLVEVLLDLSSDRVVVFPVHPRTRKKLIDFGLFARLTSSSRILLLEPQGYLAFLSLLLEADFVMTDSGGIQEETTALGISCLTLRTTTERPVTCTLGTNRLVPPDRESIRQALIGELRSTRKSGILPPLWDGHAAERIATVLRNLEW